MSSIIDIIKSLSKKYHKDIIDIRRHLHKNPELSFEEFKTVDFIKKTLKNYGIKASNIKQIANTGLEVILKGTKASSNTVIALRADIDALPIQETPPSVFNKFIKNISKILSIYPNNDKVVSSRKGVMHACGHDAHTASLLGVIRILNNIKSKFSGTVKFIFQPGEEQLPGGASIMIDKGILKNPSPQYIIGQHVMPNIKVGKVGFCKGVFTASSDQITLLIKGNQINSTIVAANIIVSLQQTISKMKPPLVASVLSFGAIQCIPSIYEVNRKNGIYDTELPNFRNNFKSDQYNKDSSISIKGTLRSMDEKWRKQAHNIITNMAKKVAEATNATCNVTITKSYPCLINNPELTQTIFEYSKIYLPEEDVIELEPQMFAEDFAYYTQKIPGCFYGLGIANDMKGINSSLHTPTFDIDENALKISMGLMSWLAINMLKPQKTLLKH